jgi:hypothetical protein
MPWTMAITAGHLDVQLVEEMRGPEWAQLMEAIFQELTVVNRVRFLLNGGLEAPGYVQPLGDLIRVLTARGVDVERRDLGPPGHPEP